MRSIRGIVVLGVMAAILCTVLYLFAAKQVAETSPTRVAATVTDQLTRSLADDTSIELTMEKLGTSPEACTLFVMTLEPSARVAGKAEGPAKLVRRAAELAWAEIPKREFGAVMTCIARSKGAELLRITIDRKLDEVPVPPRMDTP